MAGDCPARRTARRGIERLRLFFGRAPFRLSLPPLRSAAPFRRSVPPLRSFARDSPERARYQFVRMLHFIRIYSISDRVADFS